MIRDDAVDRTRALYASLHLDELRREARRQVLADRAAPALPPHIGIVVRLGNLLVQIGSRLEALGVQREVGWSGSAVTPPHGRHCGSH
jgi:hypothetical protein